MGWVRWRGSLAGLVGFVSEMRVFWVCGVDELLFCFDSLHSCAECGAIGIRGRCETRRRCWAAGEEAATQSCRHHVSLFAPTGSLYSSFLSLTLSPTISFHSNAIQAPTPTPPPQQQQQQSGGTCRYFRQGHCKYEDKCRYSHDLSRPSSSSNNNNNVYGNYQSYPGMMYPSVQMQYGVQYGGGYQQGGYAHQAGGQNGGGQHGQQSQGQGQQQHRRREHGKSRQASEEGWFACFFFLSLGLV